MLHKTLIHLRQPPMLKVKTPYHPCLLSTRAQHLYCYQRQGIGTRYVTPNPLAEKKLPGLKPDFTRLV